MALLVTLLFVWKERSTSGKRRLIIKSFFIVIAVSSLALLALKPALHKSIEGKRFLITTKGFKQSQADSLKRVYKNIILKTYSPNEAVEGLHQAQDIFVLGHGIPEFDLWQFENLNVKYLPGEQLTGVTRLNYDRSLTLGQSLEVHLEYLNAKSNTQLVLEDAAERNLDSVALTNATTQTHKLNGDLKSAGNYVLYLTEKDSLGHVLNKNPLPIKVEDQQKMRILIYNSYPTFEMKYLKNFLAELEHEVVVKNRITQNRFKSEFFNTQKLNINRLNPKLIQSFDIAIFDAEALSSLSLNEKSSLESSVRNHGLGLLIIDEAKILNSLGRFSVLSTQAVAVKEVILNQLQDVKLERQNYKFKDEFGLEHIHTSASEVISGYKRLGQGRIGGTLLENTWQLQLQGKQALYQQIWTSILDAVSKRQQDNLYWQTDTTIPIVDEPYLLKLKASLDQPKLRDAKKRLIPFQQDLTISDLWKAKLFPSTEGWNRLQLEQDSTAIFEYYVHAAEDWKTLQAYQTQNANQTFFKSNNQDSGQLVKANVAISPLWFFGLFLLGMAGLWLEPKL